MGTEIMGATRNEIERAKGAIEQHLLNKGWSKNGDALQGTCIICNGGSKGRKDTAMFWIGAGRITATASELKLVADAMPAIQYWRPICASG